jgi:hypothetical protein
VRNRIRRGGLALAAVTVGALVAGCGSSPASAPAASNDSSGGDAFAAYTACLQRNGVTLPTRGPRPSGSGSPRPRPSGTGRAPGGGFGGGFLGTQAPAGVDQQAWTRAMAACASVRPSFSRGPGGGNNSAFAAYRNCLSDHGVTLGGGGLNSSDPTVAAAMTACAPLRPTGGPGGFGGGRGATPSPTPTP